MYILKLIMLPRCLSIVCDNLIVTVHNNYVLYKHSYYAAQRFNVIFRGGGGGVAGL